jgi:methionyl aminopeptidase
MVTIKSAHEIEQMRIVGKMAGECLATMMELVKEGTSGLEIDKACYDWTKERGAYPAPLNYKGFPKSLCISPNDVICHGIPNAAKFKNGDIVNLDVTPRLNGFHGDTNATVIVGDVSAEVRQFVETARLSLWDGIRTVKPGSTLGDIGHAIQTRVEGAGYSVVLEFCGHGIGRIFHEDPAVMHVGKPGQGMKLRAGMIFTIEPMINMGKRNCYVEKDGWTARTKDKSLSAQFEHTILVTDTGYEVLTLRPGETPAV